MIDLPTGRLPGRQDNPEACTRNQETATRQLDLLQDLVKAANPVSSITQLDMESLTLALDEIIDDIT